jgi:hypothetical protein
MVTDRENVVHALRAQGDHDRALQASCILPAVVDTDKDANVLSMLGVCPSTLEEDAVRS